MNYERDDNLGLPGDDLKYRVALLVACTNPECLAPVGYLCKSIPGLCGFCYSRWEAGLKLVLTCALRGIPLDAGNRA